VKKEVLNSRHHQDFKKFQEAIDGCLADMPTKHREKLATLLTTASLASRTPAPKAPSPAPKNPAYRR